jgi:two-component system, LuxR family, response regulator FixJ
MREGSGTQSIHIVDDDEAVRDSLAALVESAGLSAKVYASAIELLTSPGGLAADCLVADIRMPEMDGLELQQELKRRGMTMPLILITGHADVGLAVQAMKAGASDFLEKPCEGERLLASITEALKQGSRKPRSNAEPNLAADRLAALTEREREVVDRLVAGLSNKEVARELGISYRTVEVHRARIMDKIQARSFSQLVRLALEADHPSKDQATSGDISPDI